MHCTLANHVHAARCPPALLPTTAQEVPAGLPPSPPPPECRNATAFDPGALEQHDYMAAGARASRPAAAAAAPTTARIVEQPGFGRSTYQLELLERDCSDIGGGPVAPRGAAPGGGSGAPSPAAQAARPGYLTTSAAAQLLMAEQFGSALSLSGGSSPAAKAALGGRGGSGAGSPAAAAEPGSWTIRAAQPAPGPACQPSSIATKASPGSGPGGRGRVPKEAAFLAALDQHSRGRVPAYTGMGSGAWRGMARVHPWGVAD